MPYTEFYFAARESWRDWRIEANELVSLARVSQGTRVLEIGCGGGGLLRLLRERGAWVVGVDTLEVALERATVSLRAAKRRSNPQPNVEIASSHTCPGGRCQGNPLLAMALVRIGEDGTLPFRDAAFDAIVGQHVVEHLLDADAALREWKRLLKPNGRLALATPNANYPDPAHFADAEHAHIFSPRELSDAAARVGFAVEACRTIFPFLTRLRALRAIGVIGYRVFQRAPHFATRGRTILLGARKS